MPQVKTRKLSWSGGGNIRARRRIARHNLDGGLRSHPLSGRPARRPGSERRHNPRRDSRSRGYTKREHERSDNRLGCVAEHRSARSILGKGVAIAIAGAGAFVIANYMLDWL